MSTDARRPARLAGRAASDRALNGTGAAVVAALVASAATGHLLGSATIVFFAVGAGAGYSLSGSV